MNDAIPQHRYRSENEKYPRLEFSTIEFDGARFTVVPDNEAARRLVAESVPRPLFTLFGFSVYRAARMDAWLG